MSKAIEETVRTEKGLIANVDFYSASTYTRWAFRWICHAGLRREPHVGMTAHVLGNTRTTG